jgi:hypothetical protein
MSVGSLASLLAQFSASVGGIKKPCPKTKPLVRYVDDGGVPTTNSATVRSMLEVSNIRTTLQLPPGFLAVSTDRDSFKVEIVDSTVSGNKIPDTSVEIEALTNKKKRFKPRRKLNVELEKVPGTDLFRSRYLRLVVDDVDRAINPSQTLLTDWHLKRPKCEILGQVIRVTYKSKTCGKITYEATVGNANRMSIRAYVHVLRKTPGGTGVVTLENAKMRVRRCFRRIYAQVSMAPKLLGVRYVDPPENLIAVSDYTGANATGGGSISFTIRSKKKGKKPKVQVIGPHTTVAGDTPIATANQLAALIRRDKKFTVRVEQNPPVLASTITQGSADLIITDPRGGRVSIEAVVATDAIQTINVGRVNIANFQGWALQDLSGATKLDWVAGSIMQRTVLQNYDTGSNRVDLFVVDTHAISGNRGEAMIPGTFYAAGKQAIAQVTMSAFVIASTMDGTANEPFVIGHEVGHTLLDAIHATQVNQMMHGAVPSANAESATKRIHETAEGFDDPPINIQQEPRMRANGAGVLLPFVP